MRFAFRFARVALPSHYTTFSNIQPFRQRNVARGFLLLFMVLVRTTTFSLGWWAAA